MDLLSTDKFLLVEGCGSVLMETDSSGVDQGLAKPLTAGMSGDLALS